jgi:PST family polysaccharide transporter
MPILNRAATTSEGRGATGPGGPPPEVPASPPSLTGVVVRGVSLAGVGYVLTQVITFVSYLALARLIEPRDFGHFTAGILVAGVGTLIGDSGMGAAVIQRQSGGEEVPNTAFLSTLASGVIMTALALGAAPLLGLFFHSHEVELIAAVMSGWLFLRMLSVVPEALLQRRLSFLRRMIIDPIAAVAFLVVALVAGAGGMGAWTLVLATYAGAVVTVVAAWALARWRPRPRLASMQVWRELARFGRPVVAGELIRRGVNEIPVAGIGRFIGAGALGQYTYALRVAAQPFGLIVNGIAYVLLPSFARLAAHEQRLRAAVIRAMRVVCAIAFPAGLILVPLGVPAMTVVFGARWHQAGYALMAVAVSYAALSLDSLASEIWKATGRVRFMPRMHGLAFVLTLALVALAVPAGLVAVCGAISLASVGVAIYALWGIHAAIKIPIRALASQVWPPVVASAVMAGALYAIDRLLIHAGAHVTGVALALLAAETLLGAGLYLASLRVIAPETTADLAALARPLLARVQPKLTRAPFPSEHGR